MSGFFFYFTLGLGLMITVFLFIRSMRNGKVSSHQLCLINAVGWGLTTLVSFFAAIVTSESGIHNKGGFISFGIVMSIIFFVTMYIVTFVVLKTLRMFGKY